MKTRRLLVTPQVGRDFNTIVAWYEEELGAKAAAKIGARDIAAIEQENK